MNSGIYGILNNINNKIYIGQSVNLSRRRREHFAVLRFNIDLVLEIQILEIAIPMK
jgi:hypothetical protein